MSSSQKRDRTDAFSKDAEDFAEPPPKRRRLSPSSVASNSTPNMTALTVLPVEWQPEFETCVSLIDTQHKGIVSRFNKIVAALSPESEGVSHSSTLSLLDDLIAYIRFHFTSEEELQRLSNFPSYESHKQIHEQELAGLDSVRVAVASGAASVTPEILQQQKEWIATHIVEHDVPVGTWIVTRYSEDEIRQLEEGARVLKS